MRTIIVLATLFLLSGCQSAPTGAPRSPMADLDLTGEQAYTAYCAGCHETGMLGAPIVGNKEDWEGRSKLWQAVVMAHARDGYFDMPARGGRPELPDATINSAVEYMLEITYEDLPAD